MTQLVLNIDDPTLVPLVRKFVNAIDGISIVSKIETLEHEPNECTLRAIKDAREGKVFRAESTDDLLEQILA